MGRPSTMRSIVAAGVAGSWIALVLASGGCEVAVGSTVPGFACLPGHADVCPSGQFCDPSSNHCVASCMVSGCKTGTCDPASNVCVSADSGMMMEGAPPIDSQSEPDSVVADTRESEPDTSPPVDTGTTETTGPCRTTGCPCSGAASCDSQICADALTVTTGLFNATSRGAQAGSSFCTQPCCTSAECDETSVCFATGQGGSYCVSPAWLGRGTSLGTAQGGASCSTGGNCRSALCDTGAGKCVDTCCSSASAASECTGGETCQFAAFPGAAAFDNNYSAFCAPPPGTHQDGSTCNVNSDCQANLCAATMGAPMNSCHGACRGRNDCGSGESCTYVLPPGQTANPMPIVASCFSGGGTLTAGQTCNPSNDMCEGFCDPNTNKCTDACFANSDCATGRCRPETVAVSGGGSYSVLCCGP